MQYTVYTKWYAEHKCIKCNTSLTRTEKMYSNAICPYCGNKSRYAATIVDTYSIPTREIVTYSINTIFPFIHINTIYETKGVH